ncbi:hypothetical protein OYC64_021990 [Pagothenia borchgrevinki]|uniref:PDZ domain-containing protein n=1 Tax=Pagothenia borchgrevinki TaxID=8213 RepID=A0ABD2G1U6_PAGBO
MKRRCVPLRADHELLTPDTHTLSGVRLLPFVSAPSEHLSDSSSSDQSAKLSRRRPASSPSRRLRFEDETETEAESRYLERQRRPVLLSKPHLNRYVYGAAGAGPVGVSLPLPEDRGRSLHRPRLHLLTEPIRETYIGSVRHEETRVVGGGAYHQVKRRTNQKEINGNPMPIIDLPINPYALDQLTTPTSYSATPTVGSAMTLQSIGVNWTEVVPNQNKNQDQNQHQEKNQKQEKNQHQEKNQKQEKKQDQNHKQEKNQHQKQDQGGPAAAQPQKDVHSWAALQQRSPSVEVQSSTAERTAPPPAYREPMRAETHADDPPLPEHLGSRDDSSRLSLRRLFSSVRLSGTRTGSLDRLSFRPRPPATDPAPSDPTPTGTRKSSAQSPSVQGSPFLQLRKSSSVQSIVSERKKKKKDRSADYRRAAEPFSQRSLTLQDVGSPSSVRCVGRVLQVSADGSVLLELIRPSSRTFGFIVSRGRGRRDSGVYVEDMLDLSTEKLFSGLLSVGDEFLEVAGQKVSALTLDQVTRLLTQNTVTTVRVLRTPPR